MPGGGALADAGDQGIKIGTLASPGCPQTEIDPDQAQVSGELWRASMVRVSLWPTQSAAGNDIEPGVIPTWPTGEKIQDENGVYVAPNDMASKLGYSARIGMRIWPGGQKWPIWRFQDLSMLDSWQGVVQGQRVDIFARCQYNDQTVIGPAQITASMEPAKSGTGGKALWTRTDYIGWDVGDQSAESASFMGDYECEFTGHADDAAGQTIHPTVNRVGAAKARASLGIVPANVVSDRFWVDGSVSHLQLELDAGRPVGGVNDYEYMARVVWRAR